MRHIDIGLGFEPVFVQSRPRKICVGLYIDTVSEQLEMFVTDVV